MLTVAFSESAMSSIQVQLWYNRLKEGRENGNDDARSGRSGCTSTPDENIKAVKEKIFDNLRITIRDVVDNVGIPFGPCQAMITDILSMKCAAAKIVVKLSHEHRSADVNDIQ